MSERLILRNFQSAGDILMLTATLRDLHRCYPGRFVTDVRTSCADLWIGNPWLTPLRDDEPGVRVVECQYPIIHGSNQAPWHFLFGFSEHLNDKLGLRIQPTEYRGDVHLTPEEREWFARVQEAHGEARPYWLFASGGKWDYTIKWWDAARYQQLVDHFRGRIDFVQVGETHHHHPDVRGVTDLLIDSAKAAAAGDKQRYRDARATLITRHRDASEALVPDLDELSQLQMQLDERVREFERLCMAVAILGELTDRGLAVISGLGERLMAPLLAAALRAKLAE